MLEFAYLALRGWKGWGPVFSVKRGMRLSRIVAALVLTGAGASLASASKLDKSACQNLKDELGGVLATGARDDMERGPEWAKANLAPDKLNNIKRLIDIEAQLEFRCGMGRRRIAAIKPASPVKKRDDKAAPAGPEKKPSRMSSTEKPSSTPAAPPKQPSNAKEAAASPPKPPSNAKKAAASPPKSRTTTARKRASRSEAKNAYVSPLEVNPNFMTRYGTTH